MVHEAAKRSFTHKVSSCKEHFLWRDGLAFVSAYAMGEVAYRRFVAATLCVLGLALCVNLTALLT